MHYAAFTIIHRSNIYMRFLSQLFTFTDITDCLHELCLFDLTSVTQG